MNIRADLNWLYHRLRARGAGHGDRGTSTVETVIIVAALAALAIATLATITVLVDAKVGGIQL